MSGDEEPLLRVEIRVSSGDGDNDGLLVPFSAAFYEQADSGMETDLGTITGWITWSVAGDDVADAADSISADAAHIGYIAQLALDAVRAEPWMDDKAMWMLAMEL